MIYIEKDELNQIVLTLTESTTISNPYFLFKFTWEIDEELDPVYWLASDTSPYTDRYNLFSLTEGTDATFKIGQYRYEVYETNNALATDETGLDLVEEGRMVVDGTAETIYD